MSMPFAQGWSQGVDVTASVDVTRARGQKTTPQSSFANVVVWLTPAGRSVLPAIGSQRRTYTLTQKDKRFDPHVLVVPTGSNVDFPNLDPFFHNVFSLFNGKRFDLGLYEPKTHRTVLFDRDGVSYIFCNIHPDMGAVIVTVGTPYFGISSRDGTIVIHNVLPGNYRFSVWAENVSVESLNALSRAVVIGAQNSDVGRLHIETSLAAMHHLNKFGEPYPPPAKAPY